MFRITLAFSFLFSFFSIIAFAQPKKLVADKIVAVVGNKIVLKSDIDNAILDMQRQGMEIPALSNLLE
jgi:peptidyl-prolyl cis-trans isomerase SurA